MLSVIIPSRNKPEWPLIHKTIDDIFENAVGEIEVVVVLDGYKPDPPIKERKNLTLIYNPESKGMRPAINMGACVARGELIMKCDDHCAFSKGFDEILTADCEDNWLVVPRRYALNGERWLAGGKNKEIFKFGPIDYLYLTPPHRRNEQFGMGLRGAKWHSEHGAGEGGYYYREQQRKKILIDDIITFQGSCWMMPKEYFFKIGMMQQEGFLDHQEAQELGFKVWLSGGRCVINKKAWYAHLHKDQKTWGGRGYFILRHKQIQSNIYSAKMWLTNSWSGQIKKFREIIEHPAWYPMDYWDEVNFDEKYWENYDYSHWYDKA